MQLLKWIWDDCKVPAAFRRGSKPLRQQVHQKHRSPCNDRSKHCGQYKVSSLVHQSAKPAGEIFTSKEGPLGSTEWKHYVSLRKRVVKHPMAKVNTTKTPTYHTSQGPQ